MIKLNKTFILLCKYLLLTVFLLADIQSPTSGSQKLPLKYFCETKRETALLVHFWSKLYDLKKNFSQVLRYYGNAYKILRNRKYR